MNPELKQLREQLVAFIADTAGSLHTQIQESERRVRAEMNQGFERLDAHLGPQSLENDA